MSSDACGSGVAWRSRPPAQRRSPSAELVSLLIDDAAVFPPGLAPLDSAIAAHRRIRRSELAGWIGPLLVPAGRHADLLPLLDDAEPLAVALIAPATEPLATLGTALTALAGVPGVSVVGVEMPLPSGTIDPRPSLAALDAMLAPGVGAALEFDGTDPAAVLAALARSRSASDRLPRGKFRTGGTTAQSSPDAGMLAAVITAAVASTMPVKFTAGLHHAVTGPHGPSGSMQYGVLNVLVAVHRAIAGADAATGADASTRGDAGIGADAGGIVRHLLRTDSADLAAAVSGWSVDEVAAVRGIFTSFGCCDVTEPLLELAELGVIDPWEEP